MRVLVGAMAFLSLLMPATSWAQPGSPADALRILIETNDLERRGSSRNPGAYSTVWRFTPPGRMSIEEWNFTTAIPFNRDPSWRGRYEFRNGRFCLKGDTEAQWRCYAIEMADHAYPVRLTDAMATHWLAPIGRKELLEHLKQDPNRK